MRTVPSKTRRNFVVAGAAGLAVLAAPKAWQTRLVQPAAAQEIPPKTGKIKVQYAHRTGRWGISADGSNSIPLTIDNQFGQGTRPVVHEVQVHFKLNHPSVSNLEVHLIGPDGYTVPLMYRPGYGSEGTAHSPRAVCSTKGVDITIVDTEVDNCCASIADAVNYCPQWTSSGVERFFGIWERKRLQGVFHTHAEPESRLLPGFNGRPAVGDWHLKVFNYTTSAFNKVIRQIDLTVYSKW